MAIIMFRLNLDAISSLIKRTRQQHYALLGFHIFIVYIKTWQRNISIRHGDRVTGSTPPSSGQQQKKRVVQSDPYHLHKYRQRKDIPA
mgnify:CR=1 FL=1